MNFNKTEVATQIVTLPQTFHSLGNISIFSLLEATFVRKGSVLTIDTFE